MSDDGNVADLELRRAQRDLQEADDPVAALKIALAKAKQSSPVAVLIILEGEDQVFRFRAGTLSADFYLELHIIADYIRDQIRNEAEEG
jgi:hypothetical protein